MTLKSGNISEQSIHKTVIAIVRLNPELAKLVMHFPNEGKRSPRYGKLLKDLGMRPGVWDLFIATGKHGYIGAWIELKSADGKLSPAQISFGEDMRQQNYFTEVCWSVDEALETINWYCFSAFKKVSNHQNFQALLR